MGNKKQYFLDNPNHVKRVLHCLYAACALLVALDLVIHRHISHSWENLWGFYALYGFVSCVALVRVATGLRRVLMRPEDYYDHEGKADPAKTSEVAAGGEDVDA